MWFKRILSQLHRYVLWLMISIFLWSWIFTLITDTTKEKKVTVCSDTPAMLDSELAEALSYDLPEGIKLIKVFPFKYAMFNTADIDRADILILPESEIEEHTATLCAIGTESFDTSGGYEKDGAVYGLLLFDAASGTAKASDYFTFTSVDAEGKPTSENYYLCFNERSVHLGDMNSSADDAAIIIAKRILDLP